jgi:shikimate kinase
LIALIGLPGSGKSTVGRQLARRLQLPFVDSDQVVEQRLGCSIREYFEREGEERFRDVEQDVVNDLTQGRDGVLSTGGGAVLHSRAHVFYLKSTPEELFRRLRNDLNRPLLQVEDPLKKLRDLFEARDPLYRETAHFVLDAGRPSVSAHVNMIAMQLEHLGMNGPHGASGVRIP